MPSTATASEAPSRILLVDDDPVQLKLHRLRLTNEGFAVDTARDAEEALVKARTRRPDAILSDVVMGELDGFGLCRRVRADPELGNVPVILLSALYQTQADRDLAIRVGASALVSRTPEFEAEIEAVYRTLLDGGAPRRIDASRPEVYERQLRATNGKLMTALEQAKRAELRYRLVFENATDAICVLTPDGVVIESNQHSVEVFGIPAEQMVGRHISEFAQVGREAGNAQTYAEAVSKREGRALIPIKRPDGSIRHVEFSTVVINVDGQDLVLSIGRDMTETVRATQALSDAEAKYRSLIERLPDVVWSMTDRGDFAFVTPNVREILGVSREELLDGGRWVWSNRVHHEDLARVQHALDNLPIGGQPLDIEFRWGRAPGRWIWVRCSASAYAEPSGRKRLEGLLSDITERRGLEDSLRQAQKMEAIGQLTGGIAHDFNNILAVIIANSYFLVSETPEGDERRGQADEIRIAAERAASLTRQLLAFSRKQVLQPTAIDLNATLSGLEKMLRRVIGEDVELSITTNEDLGTVLADAGQMEQVVMNLVVNARDALPKGGHLSIETSNVVLDGTERAHDEAVAPGRYVMLVVSDDGTGMADDTKQRLFEPFFTTKERGRGTGLGLSTCYGIVKQSNGYIMVESELGKGTSFRIYLPRVDEAVEQARIAKIEGNLDGEESVLVIEDDAGVRSAVCRILRARGYRVFPAADGREARAIAEAEGDAFDLVLSDVIVPGLSGPDAVAAVRKHAPRVKALFMSGYTDHAALRDNMLRQGANFIQKPFSPNALAAKVREVLEAADDRQLGDSAPGLRAT